MNVKQKLATIKKNIKHYAPEIIATTSVAVAVATVVYYKTRMTLETSEEDLAAIRSGDSDVTYSIDGYDYRLTARGNTPAE